MRKSAPLATKPLGKPVRKSPQHKATQKIKNKISVQRTITTARVIAPTLSHITRNPIQNTLQRPQQLPQLKQLPQQQSSAFTTSTIISLPSFNSHSSTTKPSLPLFSTQYARISTFSNTNNHNNNNLTIPTTKIPHQHKQTKLIKSSMGFKKTTPTRFVGRILMAAGLVALLIGSRYVASGLSAFHNAYKNTSNLVKPIDDGEVLEAQHELSLAAQEVNDMAEVEENERRIKKQKQEELKSRREREARKAKAGLGPANIIQDDFSDHIDIAAREKKKKLEIEAELHAMRFDSNDAEIDMNTTFYNLELVLRGDGAGFEPTMSVIEAEKILQTEPHICLEELKDRRAIMMRLNHPDHGGSPYLAEKVNEAFDILKLSAKSDPNWLIQRQKLKDEEDLQRKQYAEEILREELKKQGVLDEEGDVIHPDGGVGKKHDKM